MLSECTIPWLIQPEVSSAPVQHRHLHLCQRMLLGDQVGLPTSPQELCPLVLPGSSCGTATGTLKPCVGIPDESQLALITPLHWLLSFGKITRGASNNHNKINKKGRNEALAIQVNFSTLIANAQGSQGPLLAEQNHQTKKWIEQGDFLVSLLK